LKKKSRFPDWKKKEQKPEIGGEKEKKRDTHESSGGVLGQGEGGNANKPLRWKGGGGRILRQEEGVKFTQ